MSRQYIVRQYTKNESPHHIIRQMKTITSVSEFLLDHLKTEIIIGSFAPGEKINEYHLAETLEVSRPILREVLRTLEGEQLVDTVPRKGSYVSKISLVDFIDLYTIREMIESKAVDLLEMNKVRRIKQFDEIIEVETNLKVPPPDSSPSVFLEFFETGLRFHTVLVDAANNNRLSQYFQGIRDNLLRYHVFQGPETLEPRTKIDHVDMVKRLEKGQYAKVKEYLREHTKTHESIIKKNLELLENKPESKLG